MNIENINSNEKTNKLRFVCVKIIKIFVIYFSLTLRWTRMSKMKRIRIRIRNTDYVVSYIKLVSLLVETNSGPRTRRRSISLVASSSQLSAPPSTRAREGQSFLDHITRKSPRIRRILMENGPRSLSRVGFTFRAL